MIIVISGSSHNCSVAPSVSNPHLHLIIALLGAISESPAPALYIPIAIHLHLF